MTKRHFRVFLGLEEVDMAHNQAKRVGQHFECATFTSRAEAQDFIFELLQNHCACAAGEAKLKSEMTSPEFFTAGD